MIIEIALGIVLAVIILNFLPLIFAAGVILFALLIIVIVGFFAVKEIETVILILLTVAGLVVIPIIVGFVYTRLPYIEKNFSDRLPYKAPENLTVDKHISNLIDYYWAKGFLISLVLLFGVMVLL
jgi:hypothetical protein